MLELLECVGHVEQDAGRQCFLRQHGIPLFENEQLLQLLVDIGLGEEIPETLYLCIAQVIAFAYKIQGKVPEGWEPAAAE